MTIGLTATRRVARMQNGGGDGNEAGRGTAVITRTKTKTKKPSLY
ncbi:ATP-dependent Clp protease adaptor ClpS, partial [Mesorhizobium sp. M8A.F.Ca.ET.021.01.1.1]